MSVSTREEIKALLKAMDWRAGSDVVRTGELPTHSGAAVPWELRVGWNLSIANLCDESWGVFNVRLMRYVKEQHYTQDELLHVLSTLQLDDSHWRWLDKSMVHDTDDYKWFFLMAEDQPQAACLLYHPKPSAFNGDPVFYVEYLAAAPWNRDNPMMPRRFKGLGRMMMTLVCDHATATLGLRPGFGLHALPRAEGFYDALGMTRFPGLDKDALAYFEMPADNPLLAQGVIAQ